MGNGRFRPNSLETCARTAGDALRPAMRDAGFTPGVAKKIRNTNTLIVNITNIADARRLIVKRITYIDPRSLARGSNASRTPSPRMLSATHTITMQIPGAIATQGRV